MEIQWIISRKIGVDCLQAEINCATIRVNCKEEIWDYVAKF